MTHDFDDLIKEAFEPTEIPTPDLNRQILMKAKENNQMKKQHLRKAIASAACIGLVAISSISTYAAYRYLSPSQIADRLSDQTIKDAFASKNAIEVNEMQTTNGYNITLFGLASGIDLQPHIPDEHAKTLEISSTYAIVTIEKADGSNMEYRDFCISPLINGVDFMIANNASLHTSLIFFEQDGILYYLMESDNLEIFADRGVQLGVVDSFGKETQAFYMNEETGAYHKQEEYEKTSALFSLPLDKKNADETAADAYIQELMNTSEKIEANEESEKNDHEINSYLWEISTFVRSITPENINDYFERDEKTEFTAFPDENGWIDFGTKYIEEEDYYMEGTSGSIEYLISDTENFSIRGYGYGSKDLSNLSIRTFWRNEDGSFTSVIYRAKVDLSFLLE